VAKRILVPLDRSAASEAMLPIVADIARNVGSTVRLLNVQPVPAAVIADNGRVVAYRDQEMARFEAMGQMYLQGVEAALDGIPVERVVRFGEAAEEILVEADAWDAELIVMASRPATRLPRLRGGDVDGEVSRRATRPVLRYQTAAR
jgi:nucleotide-binding universal stress UspA family protein